MAKKKVSTSVRIRTGKGSPVFPPQVKQHKAAIKRLEQRLTQLQQQPNGLAGGATQNRIRYEISQHQANIDALMKAHKK